MSLLRLTSKPDWVVGFAGDSAWSPESSSYDHHLTVDLGGRFEIRSIATRGRSNTNEFVTEYIVQFSEDAQAWISYENQEGTDEVHSYSNSLFSNYFGLNSSFRIQIFNFYCRKDTKVFFILLFTTISNEINLWKLFL